MRRSLLSAGENWCVLSSWRLVVAEAGQRLLNVSDVKRSKVNGSDL